jgi:hypothetical protein
MMERNDSKNRLNTNSIVGNSPKNSMKELFQARINSIMDDGFKAGGSLKLDTEKANRFK